VVSTEIEAVSTEGQDLVKRIRAVPAPSQAYVTGFSAELLDARTVMVDRIPLALGIMVATTLIVLFLLTGGADAAGGRRQLVGTTTAGDAV
jgi:putative drug exporter of the RND superfamily